MRRRKCRVVAEDAEGRLIKGRNMSGLEAQRWAERAMPDVVKITIYSTAGQSKGWYQREADGSWRDLDPWLKSW